MKYIFCFAVICSAGAAIAQGTAQKMPVKPIYELPGSGGLLDTTQAYASRYGKVARLTLDNIPCIMPYGNVTPVPNPPIGKPEAKPIPNLWQKTQIRSNTRNRTKVRMPKDARPSFYFKLNNSATAK